MAHGRPKRTVFVTGTRMAAALLSALVVVGSAWGQSVYENLDVAVPDLARRLVSEAGLGDERVLVIPHDFFEENTGRRLPLSETLSSRFRSALSGHAGVSGCTPARSV